MAERPNHIPLPPAGGLRSALKHPQTPASTSSTTSSPQSPAAVPGNASPMLLGAPLISMPTGSSTSTSGAGYLPKVSFDTFENSSAPMFSYTLQAKSEGYRRDRSTRVFLVAASPDESGIEALDWVMDSLVQDGDELIVFRGFDTEDLDGDHDAVRDEARELLRQVQRQNNEYEPDRKLSIIVEFIAGKATETIERLIALYRPDSLVVGTRGQRGVKVLGAALGGMGSVSKYCLSHSPVPVIVVRPERKVRKTMMKRRNNPKRGIHFEEKSPSIGPTTSSPSITPTTTRQ
ncbi:hypothetical protein DFH11DRAFT_385683 [Phellopilus nigrolimitatus]|nr:hypothetical protein DFH11DRAFT_385683 [Phellopilus nigrolimitatus]